MLGKIKRLIKSSGNAHRAARYRLEGIGKITPQFAAELRSKLQDVDPVELLPAGLRGRHWTEW